MDGQWIITERILNRNINRLDSCLPSQILQFNHPCLSHPLAVKIENEARTEQNERREAERGTRESKGHKTAIWRRNEDIKEKVREMMVT